MKEKFKNLGRILSKNEQKEIGGGLSDGCWTFTYTGCNDCGGPNQTCDYHLVKPNGNETDLCDQGCFSDCQTEGCVHTVC